MPGITRVYGIALFLLGLAGYTLTGAESATALIPSFFGIVFIILGRLAQKETIRKHVMHAAVLVALIALAGSFSGIVGLIAYLGGDTDRLLSAAISQTLMALFSMGYIVLAVRSFVNARKTPVETAP